ncbi:GNAT family N-acetyltransferase [Agrilactobacillus fermenti]|uniref:GNAT family N-acetyltransferase n=1 Tax=Agrilactobacillus fermenti TaxID=2586909 RepID=UPI001E372EC4|nr:GNAT family N-acetyltransferase [Agrilactobacillus fermenti]MCD2255610.1 GNAT family N-acetyltransferase [Agrilactobacillus fermenti]
MQIEIKVNAKVTPSEIARLYQITNFDKAIDDIQRLKIMLDHTPLTLSAWHDHQLIGFARCLTDYEYSCYLSDIVIDPNYQHLGLGQKLISELQRFLGSRVTIALRAEPSATGFYQKCGFQSVNNMFRIHREA